MADNRDKDKGGPPAPHVQDPKNAPQVVPGDLPQGTIPADQSTKDPAEAITIANAQVKMESSDDDDDFSDFPPPERQEAPKVSGSTTRPGGAYWVGNRLVNAEGVTLKIHQPVAAKK